MTWFRCTLCLFNRGENEMKHYSCLLLVFLIACAESGGSKPGSSSSSSTEPAKTNVPAKPTSTTTAAATPANKDKLENSPLVWKPTTNIASVGSVDLTGLANTKLQVANVVDGRQNRALLGQNKEKSTPRIITTPDDVPAFVTGHMKEIISATGITVADSAPTRILKTELKQFYVEETDTYKGDVRMVVTLTDASGKSLWNGTTGGSATRFGRSYKAENYYETLSDSLIEAVFNLVRNPGFHDALAKP
jgi:hypothetical protein